jgi:hypothetical protein
MGIRRRIRCERPAGSDAPVAHAAWGMFGNRQTAGIRAPGVRFEAVRARRRIGCIDVVHLTFGPRLRQAAKAIVRCKSYTGSMMLLVFLFAQTFACNNVAMGSQWRSRNTREKAGEGGTTCQPSRWGFESKTPKEANA